VGPRRVVCTSTTGHGAEGRSISRRFRLDLPAERIL
jgi:hypothetical protein